METVISQLYATFGVFAFIIIGMGLIIRYLVNELKEERKAQAKLVDKFGDILVRIQTFVERIQ